MGGRRNSRQHRTWRAAPRCATLLAAALALISPGQALPHAASFRTVPDGYTRRVWQMADGLPENTVQAFAQTPDHYLWIGTSGGLVRFDGERFVVFAREDHPQILDNSVFSLMVARDGSLWAGTDGGGVFHYKDGVFRSYAEGDGIGDRHVRVVYQDHAGVIWAGTDRGLFRLDKSRFERVDGRGEIPALAVHGMYEDRANGLWVGGSRLLRIQDGKCREFSLPGARSANRVKSILETRDGTIWVGTVAGLERMAPGTGRFEAVPGITTTIRVLRQDAEGTPWIGSIGDGLMRYRDGRVEKVATPEDPPSSTVLSVFEDDEQNIWVGLQTGLLRLSRTALSTFPLPGAQNADFGTVYADRDSSLWVGSSHLYRIGPNRDRAEEIPDPGPGIRVRCVFRDRAGDWWVGTEGHGVFLTQRGKRIHYTKQNGLTNDFVRAFLEARDGSVWIGTDEGVTHWVNGRAIPYRESDGLCYFSVRALLQDRQGDIWIGTEQGVSRFHNGRFASDTVTKTLAQDKVWAIHEDPQGGIWFGTRGNGLFRWRDGKLTHFTSEQGLASNNIYEILEDSRGTFWMSGPDGISAVKRSDLDQFAKDPGFRPAVTLYGLSDGLEATQMDGGVQPAGCVTPRGEIWFASNRGPVRIAPDQARPSGLAQVVIERVLVDGRDAGTSGDLVVPPGDGRLQIDYAAIRLRSQERIRFRYRLLGFDRGWFEALQNRVAYYTNLPPGEYRFQVQAFEMNMPDRATEAELGIAWQPHMYRTRWFLGLCASLLLGLAFLGYRLRLGQVRQRFEAVLAERGRIAREMHDTVIQGCASASALLEAVALEPDLRGDARGLLDSARQQVRATVDEARSAVWNLRHEGQRPPEIGPLLEQIAQQASQLGHLPVKFEAHGRPVALDEDAGHALLMVAREAVYNAVRHGHPSEVRISVQFADSCAHMEIADDGRGFDPAAVLALEDRHFGLVGMRERVESLGGRFRVDSEPERGTRIHAEVPIRNGNGKRKAPLNGNSEANA